MCCRSRALRRGATLTLQRSATMTHAGWRWRWRAATCGRIGAGGRLSPIDAKTSDWTGAAARLSTIQEAVAAVREGCQTRQPRGLGRSRAGARVASGPLPVDQDVTNAFPAVGKSRKGYHAALVLFSRDRSVSRLSHSPSSSAPAAGLASAHAERQLIEERSSTYNNIYVYKDGPHMIMNFGHNKRFYTEIHLQHDRTSWSCRSPTRAS